VRKPALSHAWIIRTSLFLLLFCLSPLVAAAQQKTGAQGQKTPPKPAAAAPAAATLQPLPPPEEKEMEGADFLREREAWFLQDRRLPDGSVGAGMRLRALQHVQLMIDTQRSMGLLPPAGAVPLSIGFPGPTTWTSIGPMPITVPASGFPFNGSPANSGRVAAVAVDPTNKDIAYLGAAAGGVWKTTDGGASWTPLTDSQASLSTGSIAVDPTATSCSPAPCKIIYIGTGESNNSADSYYGAGILKSTDGGTTWTQQGAGVFVGPFTSSRLDGAAHIGAIAVDPFNNQVVLAGVKFRSSLASSGIYRTIDGGTTWALVAAMSGADGTAIVFDPVSTGIVYAALGTSGGNAANGVYRSADHGVTWTKMVGSVANPFPPSGVGRIDLDLAKTSPTTLYALIGNSSGASLRGMWKTVNANNAATADWIQQGIPDVCTSSGGSQCLYDLIVRVSPTDANLVFAGGSSGNSDNSRALFRSPDGGTSWTSVANGSSGTGLHVDLHALAFAQDGTRLYVGNDGGAWRSDSPSALSIDYVNLNATLAITMSYPGHGVHFSDENIMFVGTQDNGSQRYSGSFAWNIVTGGDGAQTAIDPHEPSTVYTACQFVCIFRSLTDGTTSGSFTFIGGGIPSERSRFIAPLTHDPNILGRVYFGTFRVWRSTDRGNTWSAISPDLTGGLGALNAIAVSRADSNFVYAGGSTGTTSSVSTFPSKVWKSTNALSVSPTFTEIDTGLPPRNVTSIGLDRNNTNIAYATFSGFSGFGGDTQGHVFRTSDGGTTWQDVSGTGITALPNIPVNDILVDNDLTDVLYAATDVGVFHTNNASLGTGTIWSPVPGLPNVIVNSLNARNRSRIVRASTSGRGTWVIQDLNVGIPAGPLLTSMSPASATVNSASAGISLAGANFTTTSQVQWNGAQNGITTTFVDATHLTATIPAALLTTGQVASVTVFDSTQTPNTSSQLRFTVENPIATPANLSPISGTVGTAVALHITGSGFVTGIDVIFNGIHNTNGVVSSGGTVLDITIPGSELSIATTVFITLPNPPPGGGVIPGAFAFTINPAAGPAVVFSPFQVNFGNQNTSSTSAATNIQVTNGGSTDLVINASGITLTGTNSGDFALVAATAGSPQCNLGAAITTVPASTSCFFGVNFTPLAAGARSASVNVADNAPGSPQTIPLSGTGVVSAVTRTFTNGGGDGLWTTAANWNPSGVPASAETAVIPGALSVTLNTGAQTIATLTMTTTGTLTISGSSSLSFTSPSTATNITISNGTLTANASLAVSGALGLNNAAATLGGSGTVTVSSPINWSAGTMASPGTTVSNGTTNWTGGTLGLGRTFNNNGTMNLSSTLNLIGTLNNNFAGTVNTASGGTLQNLTGGLGTFNNAGALNNTAGNFSLSSITFTNTGSVNVNGGALAFSGGSNTQTAGTTTVAGGATLGGPTAFSLQGGILRGTGTISATLTNNGGAVNPGTSAGTLTILGNYNQGTGGTLNIEIGGTAAGSFDVLTAGVTANLGGTLNVTLINAFTPVLGDSFTIMTFPALIGTFATTSFPPLGGGLVLNIAYNPGSVVLTVSNAPAPVVTLNPPNVPFVNQKVGTTGATTSVTLSNSGNATLNLTSLTKAGTDPTQFSLVLSPTGGFTCTGTNVLTAGQSCTFGVNFGPTTTGAKSANIAVASNAPATNLPMTGTGTVPIATPSTGAVPFGDQRVGTTSGVQSVTLTNTGQASLSLATVALGGTNPTQFAIAAGTTCTNGSTVNAGASCVANLTFTPTTTGAKSATLTFTDDSNGVAGSTQVANLTGNGVVPGTGILPAGPINFGNQPVSTTGAATTFTVTNTGGATLNITNIALTGTDPTQFLLTNSGAGSCSPLPKAVAPAANCTFSAAFAPTATGAKNANATLTDDAGGTAGAQQNIGLSGTGVTATVNLAPSPVNFVNQRKGTTSGATTVTLTNSGGAALHLAGANAVAISGTNAADFTVVVGTTTCTNGATIAASGGTCVINITFTPGATAARTATVTVTDDANPTTQTDTLNGTGIFPAATLTPPALNFNNQIIATTSAAQTLTLQNTGTDTLNLAAANAVALGGTDATSFAIAGGTTCLNSAALAPNATCVITITFGPATPGAKSANATITDDVAPPQSSNLTGTGVTPPTATLSQNSLVFAAQRTLTTSAAQTVTVTNSGGATLHISSVAISGANAGDFALASGTTCTNNSTVNGGGSTCTINVTITPSATGARNATITITDDANATGTPGTTQTISLSGTGIAPAASLAPPSLNFGNQRVGSASAAQTITVTNSGTDVLKLAAANAVTITGANAADFAIAAGTTCVNGLSVAVGNNCVVKVTFTPGATLARNATLNIADDATGSPQTAGLTGTGIFPVVSLNPASVTFPTTAVSATSAIQTVTLTNTGTDTLHIQANVSIGGPNAADFALAAGTTCINGAAVAPNGTCLITFTFTPSANGVRSGTATVTDDANPTTQAIPLSGTTPPTATLSTAALVFGNQGVGTTSAAQAITVTNSGGVALNISATPAITGTNAADFAVATGTTCTNGAAVAGSGGTCMLNVTFHPTATGARGPATLTLTDNAGGTAGTTQTITLNGTGIDFALSTSTATATVPAGQPATFTFTVTPGGNGFPSAVQFSASGLPAATTATFNPTTVTPNGSPATTTLTLTTTARTAAAHLPGSPAPWTPRPENLLLWLGAVALCLGWLTMRRQGIGSRRYAAYLPLVLLLLSLAAITACTSGPTGTPVGTSTITVTATSGSLSHTTTVTLTVQ
jgi:hypothetical protein